MATPEMTTYTNTRETWTHDEVDASLCVWEWMLETKPGPIGAPTTYHPDALDSALEISRLFNDNGTATMRNVAMRVGKRVEEVWALYQRKDDTTELIFDWEFVPTICRMLPWKMVVDEFMKKNSINSLWSSEQILARLTAMSALGLS